MTDKIDYDAGNAGEMPGDDPVTESLNRVAASAATATERVETNHGLIRNLEDEVARHLGRIGGLRQDTSEARQTYQNMILAEQQRLLDAQEAGAVPLVRLFEWAVSLTTARELSADPEREAALLAEARRIAGLQEGDQFLQRQADGTYMPRAVGATPHLLVRDQVLHVAVPNDEGFSIVWPMDATVEQHGDSWRAGHPIVFGVEGLRTAVNDELHGVLDRGYPVTVGLTDLIDALMWSEFNVTLEDVGLAPERLKALLRVTLNAVGDAGLSTDAAWNEWYVAMNLLGRELNAAATHHLEEAIINGLAQRLQMRSPGNAGIVRDKVRVIVSNQGREHPASDQEIGATVKRLIDEAERRFETWKRSNNETDGG